MWVRRKLTTTIFWVLRVAPVMSWWWLFTFWCWWPAVADDEDAADLAGVARRKQWWAHKVVGSISGGLDWAADDEDNQGGWQLIKLTKSWHCQEMFAEKNTFCGKGFVFWSSLTQHPPPGFVQMTSFFPSLFFGRFKGESQIPVCQGLRGEGGGIPFLLRKYC